MEIFCFGKKLQHLCRPSMMFSSSISSWFHQFGTIRLFFSSFLPFLFHRVNHFWIQLFYFLIVSLFGYLALAVTNPSASSRRPKNFDIFFTSVSAATDSSMSTVEMEVFSNSQLIILTILMLLGGEIFLSVIALQFQKSKILKTYQSPTSENSSNTNLVSQLEMGLVIPSSHTRQNPITSLENITTNNNNNSNNHHNNDDSLKYNSIRFLSYVILGYLLVMHAAGSSLVSMYISFIPSAKQVLESKNLKIQTFSIFTVVSTFSNCGFVPTNENMVIFKKNPGLLLILIPQALLGNTLYPTFLRLGIWVLNKIRRRQEYEYLLRDYTETGYRHLMSGYRSWLLGVTTMGFVLIQMVLFCFMEWNDSEAMDGLNTYQEVIAALFQVTSTRHTGQSVFDISILSPAILVLFVLLMYLPSYTLFVPTSDDRRDSSNLKLIEKGEEKKKTTFVGCLILSPLSYLVIFVILICITEREKMKNDPLNFNVLTITFEVISAYGNVGLSTGYSCKRQLKPDALCKDYSYGFVGRWSYRGKFILIIVMMFGRMKKFVFRGGQAWILS